MEEALMIDERSGLADMLANLIEKYVNVKSYALL